MKLKTMKKTILSILFICTITITSQAQGLYFGGSLGYGIKAGSATLGSNNNLDGSSDVVKGSFGAGFAPSLSVGYLFNKNIGAELGLGYLFGANTTIKDNSSLPNSSIQKSGAHSFYLNPSFVIRGGEGKIVPYGKMGIFLGLANSGTNDIKTTSISNSNGITNTDDKFTYKGGISTGLTTAFGVDFMVTDKFAIFGELFGKLASWTPSKYTAVTTMSNGSTSYTTSTSGDLVKHTPANYTGTNQSASVLPFSSIGLNFGVRYYLSK